MLAVKEREERKREIKHFIMNSYNHSNGTIFRWILACLGSLWLWIHAKCNVLQEWHYFFLQILHFINTKCGIFLNYDSVYNGDDTHYYTYVQCTRKHTHLHTCYVLILNRYIIHDSNISSSELLTIKLSSCKKLSDLCLGLE